MLIQMLSSLSLAAVMALMRRWSQIREFTTMPFYTVLTHQDAALRIIGIIAGMDADALKLGTPNSSGNHI
mgnify:CR=1 FL=1